MNSNLFYAQRMCLFEFDSIIVLIVYLKMLSFSFYSQLNEMIQNLHRQWLPRLLQPHYKLDGIYQSLCTTRAFLTELFFYHRLIIDEKLVIVKSSIASKIFGLNLHSRINNLSDTRKL